MGSNLKIPHIEPSRVGSMTRAGALWSMIQIVGRNVVSLGATAILARLLAPSDYGLFVMVGTISAFLTVISDMGLSWATIQQKSLNSDQLSNMLWINVAAGVVMAVTCYFSAELVAEFYGRPELIAVAQVMAFSFVVGSLSVQPMASWNRRMRFRRVALIESSALLLGACVSVLCAVLGWGYWSLVVQVLSQQVARALASFPNSGVRLRLPRLNVGTSELATFGGVMVINSLLIYLSRNFDAILIGRARGPEELGLYSRAYFLMLLPSTLATGVLANLMIPALSALQDDPRRYTAAYRRAVRLIAGAACPISAGLALVADDAIRIVYGPNWNSVAPLLVWLSVAGISQPIYNTTGWLFTSSGKATNYLWVTAINAATLMTAFAVGIHWGAYGVAVAYGLTMGVVLTIPALILSHRAAKMRFSQTFRDLIPVFGALSAMVIAVLLTKSLATHLELNWQIALIAKIGIGSLVYCLASKSWLGPLLATELLPVLQPLLGISKTARWSLRP